MNWLKTQVRKRAKVIGVLIFGVIILIAIRQYMQANNLTFTDLTQQLEVLLAGTWYGPILYIIFYLIRPLILFPASLLTILGGSIFGLFPGALIVLVAGTLSSVVPYGVGWSLSDSETKTTEDAGQLRRFINLLKDNPFQAVLTMRLLYLPYDAVSILAGTLRINFAIFMLATAIGNIGGTLAYVGLGSSIQGDITTGDISFDPNLILFSAVVLVLGLGLSRILKQFTPQSTTTQEATS